MLLTGDEFPNLKLDSMDGKVNLRDRWRERPVVVMFMRHFGCAFCREQLIKMGRAADEFDELGAEIVAIFQYGAEATRDFCDARKVPFDCLGDPLREGYNEVSLGKAGKGQTISWKIAKRYVGAI